MIEIRQSEFDLYGCPSCGCSHFSLDWSSQVDKHGYCGECKEEFNIVRDEYMDSIETKEAVSYKKIFESSMDLIEDNPTLIEEIKSNLEFINIYLDPYNNCVPHPRKGTPKHKLVIKDVRPEDGIGEYCTPRPLGYDLACFVKSKEAGQRITDMINKINEESDEKLFSCWLDYRKNEPLWIQVKINYKDKTRASILRSYIINNDNIITEDIVRKVLTLSDKECQEYLEERERQKTEKCY